jgi:hypothetical protein
MIVMIAVVVVGVVIDENDDFVTFECNLFP